MPKRDKQYMAAKRDEILDAALTCLARTGLAGLSTTAICEEAGISMGALYTHFTTKDDIVRGVAERAVERRLERFNVKNIGELRRQLLAMAANAGDDPASLRVDLELISAAATNPRLAKVLQRLAGHGELVDTLRRLKASGEIRSDLNPEVAAMALEALRAGFSIIALMADRRDSKTFRAAMAAVLEALLAPAG